MKLLGEFETCSNYVKIYKTDFVYHDEELFMIISVSKKDDIEYVRYGNATQTNSIIKTYRAKEGSIKPYILRDCAKVCEMLNAELRSKEQ